MLGFLCFLATFKSFLQDTVKCVDITTKQYSLSPSLINIFHTTNNFLAKFPIFCSCLVPGRRREMPERKRGPSVGIENLPAPSKGSKWTKTPWLFIHDLFLSPKNICFSYLNLYKQKKNLIHCMAWVTPLIKDTTWEQTPLLKFTLVLGDNGGYLRGLHPKWVCIFTSSTPLTWISGK